MAFVVKEKLQKRLKAKQRQQEQISLLQMALWRFVVSFLVLLDIRGDGDELRYFRLALVSTKVSEKRKRREMGEK